MTLAITPPAMPVKLAGSKGRAFSIDSAGTTGVELDVYKWSMTIDSKNLMVGNNRDGRLRVAGNVDVSDGSASMYYDTANQQCSATGLNLRHGQTINLQLNPDGTSTPVDAYRLAAIIDTVKPSTEFDGTNNYDITFSLQSGDVKYPSDT